MDDHIYKRHNKSLLLYHLVFPLKYRRKALIEESRSTLKDISNMSMTKLVRTIKV